MNKNLFLSVISIFLLSFFFISCKKENAAKQRGTLLNYTNIPSSEFDRIDIIVDGKVAGSLTKPFTVKPGCGAPNSEEVAAISLEVGKYQVYAIQYKDGKNVGEWPVTTENIKANSCTPANWVD